jgi:hypothetical protein
MLARKFFFIVPLCAAVGVSGCATTSTLAAPTSRRQGQIGTYYEIDVGGKNWGDVKVWSPGAFPAKADGEREMVQLELRLRNDSSEELIVDLERSELEIVTKDRDSRKVHVVHHLEKTSGSDHIPPESTQRLELYFALPEDVAPRHIEALDLSWVIKTPAGIYSQSTPFVRQDNADRTQKRVVYSSWYPWYPWYPWPYSYWRP